MYIKGEFGAGLDYQFGLDHGLNRISDSLLFHLMHNRVFSKCTRMAIMPILASEALFRENKKNQ